MPVSHDFCDDRKGKFRFRQSHLCPASSQADKAFIKRYSYDFSWFGQRLILTSQLVLRPLSEKWKFFRRARTRTWYRCTRSVRCNLSLMCVSWSPQSSYCLVCTDERSSFVDNLQSLILVAQNSKNRLQFPLFGASGHLFKTTGNRHTVFARIPVFLSLSGLERFKLPAPVVQRVWLLLLSLGGGGGWGVFRRQGMSNKLLHNQLPFLVLSEIAGVTLVLRNLDFRIRVRTEIGLRKLNLLRKHNDSNIFI